MVVTESRAYSWDSTDTIKHKSRVLCLCLKSRNIEYTVLAFV